MASIRYFSEVITDADRIDARIIERIFEEFEEYRNELYSESALGFTKNGYVVSVRPGTMFRFWLDHTRPRSSGSRLRIAVLRNQYGNAYVMPSDRSIESSIKLFNAQLGATNPGTIIAVGFLPIFGGR